MPKLVYPPPTPSLRQIVLAASGQDVRRCRNCSYCGDLAMPEMDISLESLVTLVQMNDEEVLTSRTLWSDEVLEAAKNACNSGIDLPAVLKALRREAERRGLDGKGTS